MSDQCTNLSVCGLHVHIYRNIIKRYGSQLENTTTHGAIIIIINVKRFAFGKYRDFDQPDNNKHRLPLTLSCVECVKNKQTIAKPAEKSRGIESDGK